jgi:hypothetical protein
VAEARRLRVRDPVHGFISYGQEEQDLLDTRPLQRLRGIRQLALTSLVYPGATHARFEHSLGAMHIAGRMAAHLSLSKRETRLLRLAALLHDVGHFPLSHAGESAAIALTPEMAGLGEEAHEIMTAALIERDREIGAVLTKEDDRLAILDILEKGRKRRRSRPPDPLLFEVISGHLDADKLDYLPRDSMMAGVKYGVFDVERVIDSLLRHSSSGERHLAVRKGDLRCVEQAVLARFFITDQVYRHPVRRITDAMLREAIIMAAELTGSPGPEIAELFRCLPRSDGYLPRFLAYDDMELLALLGKLPSKTRAGKLAHRLLERRLLKQAFECRIDQIPGVVWRERLLSDPSMQRRLAQRIARALDMETSLVILDVREQSNPLYRDPFRPPEEDILVVDEYGRDERLGDVEGGLSEAAKVKPEASLCVYAPADKASSAARRKMEASVRRVIEDAARGGRS